MIKKRTTIILSIASLLLLLPLVAMQFTEEVDWNAFDFVIAAILLYGTGIAIDFALEKLKGKTSKILIPVLLFLILLLVWAELGVGIFGTPFAGD